MTNQQKYLHFDNLPNRLTLFRVILIPFIIGLLYFSQFAQTPSLVTVLCWSALVLFVIASFTDFLDGHIARKRNLVTVFGGFLDPIADKFLVISTLIILQSLDRLSVLIVIILVLREVYMLSLRLLALTENISVPVNWLGKWKTAVQMIGVGFLITGIDSFYFPFLTIGRILIYIACFLAIYSAIIYSIKMLETLKAKRSTSND